MNTTQGETIVLQPLAAGLRQGKREWMFADRSVIAIGRGRDRDIRLRHDDRVSDLHALIERVAPGTHVIRDCRSTNGTWIDGRPLDSDGMVLRMGMRLQIGQHTLWTMDTEGRAPVIAYRVTDLCKGLIHVYGSCVQAAKRLGKSREYVRLKGNKR